jgi:hypothetical protein
VEEVLCVVTDACADSSLGFSTISAVLHPIFRWALPGWYTRTEAKLKKIQEELVRSVHQLGQPGELAESRVREEALSG